MNKKELLEKIKQLEDVWRGEAFSYIRNIKYKNHIVYLHLCHAADELFAEVEKNKEVDSN